MSNRRPRHRASAALVLLVASLAAWWWTSAAPSPDAPAERGPAVSDAPPPAESAPVSTRRRPRDRRAAGPTGPGSPPPEPSAPTSTTAQEWTVLVLDRQDRPIPGARIDLLQPQKEQSRHSGPDGIVRLGAYDDGVTVEIDADSLGLGKRVLERTHTVLRVADSLPLEIEVVDARTGAPIPAHVPMQIALRAGSDAARAPVGRRGQTFELDGTAFGPGRWGGVTLHVDPPAGYAMAYGPAVWAGGRMSRYTERVRLTVAVRPVASVAVTVRETDGQTASDVRVDRVVVGATEVAFAAGAPDERGRIVVTGLPYLQGERTRVLVSKDGRHALASDLVFTVDGDVPHCVVTLPAEANDAPAPPSQVGYGIGGASSGYFSRRRGDATLDVTVRRRNGRLAAQTQVRIDRHRTAQTDSAGRVRFDELWAGEHVVEVREPGFTWVSERVTTAGEGEHALEILEPLGREISVRVVDADGIAVPFASVDVSHLTGPGDAYVIDGVQILGRHTDERGVCVLRHMPSVELQVSATLGNRHTRIAVGARQSAAVELRLPAPE